MTPEKTLQLFFVVLRHKPGTYVASVHCRIFESVLLHTAGRDSKCLVKPDSFCVALIVVLRGQQQFEDEETGEG